MQEQELDRASAGPFGRRHQAPRLVREVEQNRVRFAEDEVGVEISDDRDLVRGIQRKELRRPSFAREDVHGANLIRKSEFLERYRDLVTIGVGMPDSHAIRGAVVAASFAEQLGVDAEVLRHAYYLRLFAMAGCSAEAHTAASVLGDEVLFGEAIYGRDVVRMSRGKRFCDR